MRNSLIVSALCAFALLSSCGGTSDQESSENNSQTKHSEQNGNSEKSVNLEVELISVISDLNVRSTPGKDGVVIDKLKYGQRTIFLGEESDYKEKIIMRGIPRFSSWMKVRFSGSGGKGATDGWMYGGGLVLKEEAYVQQNDSTYKREFQAISSGELSELIGVDILYDGYASGSMEFIKHINNFRKNGDFNFSKPLNKTAEKPNEILGVSLTGNFLKGKLNGDLSKTTTNGSDTDYISVLTYNKGVCSEASVIGTFIGQELDFSSSDSKECSFRDLEKNLNNFK